MARRTHTEFQELVAAYSIDALEADELDVVEQHLSSCPKCRAELQDHRDTAGYLAYAGADAPDGLWERIVGQLEAEPPADAKVFPFAAQPSRSKINRWRIATGIAAATAAVLIATNGLLLLQQDKRIDGIEPTTISALAEQAAADSTSRLVSMRSADGKATADAVIRPNGTAYLLHSNLPTLLEGETYQLWGIKVGRDPISLSVLGTSPKVVGFTAKLDLDQLAITIEKAGGSAAPTRAPLVRGVFA